jgi:hypothetical protein
MLVGCMIMDYLIGYVPEKLECRDGRSYETSIFRHLPLDETCRLLEEIGRDAKRHDLEDAKPDAPSSIMTDVYDATNTVSLQRQTGSVGTYKEPVPRHLSDEEISRLLDKGRTMRSIPDNSANFDDADDGDDGIVYGAAAITRRKSRLAGKLKCVPSSDIAGLLAEGEDLADRLALRERNSGASLPRPEDRYLFLR